MGNSTTNRLGMIGLPVLFLTGALPGHACDSFQNLGVNLFDEARANSAALDGAKKEAAWLLRSACIKVNWTDCVATDPSPCGGQAGNLELHILAEPITKDASEDALGFAMPSLGRAAVFYLRTRQAALANPAVDVRHVLGCAIAHELGHLLLRSKEHASEGVMRGVFGPAEMTKASQRQLTFTVANRAGIHESAVDLARANGRESASYELGRIRMVLGAAAYSASGGQ